MKMQVLATFSRIRVLAFSRSASADTSAGERNRWNNPLKLTIAILCLSLFLATPGSASAAPEIAPGATRNFSTPDGGETECRIDSLSVNCGFPTLRFSGTDFDTGAKEVYAVFEPTVGTFGEANHASASIFNDFTVTESSLTPPGSGGVIPAHISVGFDYRAFLLGSAAYTVEGELNLVVSDVTDGAPGVPVASLVLATRDRSGDQGLTDIGSGGQSVVLQNEGNGFTILVRRGHTYRITFQATAYGAALLVGRPSSDVTAKRNQLRVTLDEDEVELLMQHDTDIKDAIASHDHDVKQLLFEVIRHLHTPPGRRYTDTLACDGGPCDYPYKPDRSRSSSTQPVSCPAVPEGTEVDASGCALADFCALQNRSVDCTSADWQEDELASPRDCRWRNGTCQPR
jgi:hypothetical protein